MKSSRLAAINFRNSKPVPISAKGPQDCVPLSPQQFQGCMIFVARAFMSNALLPKEFFSGVPATGTLSQDAGQRTLISAFAHFKQNGVLALSFFCRYKAMIALRGNPDFGQWIMEHEKDAEFAVFHPALISCAARETLLPSGSFDLPSFHATLVAESNQFDPFPRPVSAEHQRETVVASADHADQRVAA